MKATDEKIANAERGKGTQPLPTHRKSPTPVNKKQQEFAKPAASGVPKKVQPEEWRGSHQTENQNNPIADEEDVDEEDIETEETTA